MGNLQASHSLVWALGYHADLIVKVQLLKHGDLIRYLQAIIPVLEEVHVDSTRLAAVHASALSMNHGRGRKETG